MGSILNSGGRGTGVFITFFSIPFAGVGTFMLVLTVWTLAVYFQQQGWEEAPAVIKSAELEEHRGSDSTTYSVKASYNYEYGGRTYRDADKVSQYTGSGNISSYHQDIYRELKEYMDSGEEYRCFVNPDKPGQAVLNRDLRAMSLVFFAVFAVVFGGVGYGLMTLGIRSLLGSKKKKELENAFPGEPWRQKPEWAQGLIKSSGKTILVFSIIFAVFWNVVSFPIAMMVLLNEAGKGDLKIYLVLIFPVVGVFLILWAVFMIVRWRKFGESEFRMDTVPGVIGGALSGKICTTVDIAAEDGYRVSLRCVNRYMSGSGKNRTTHERTLWESEKIINSEFLEKELACTEIPVVFAIPYSEKPTDESNSRNSIIWKLLVSAAVPGIDYSAEFEVPVFKTDDSDPEFSLSELGAEGSRGDEQNGRELVRRAGIVISPGFSGGGTRYLFPMARNWKTSLLLTLFAILWTGVVGGIYFAGAPLLFLIVFGAVDIILIICVFNSWLDKRVVEADKYSLKMSGGILGIGRSREVDSKEIDGFGVHMTSQSGNTTFYKVLLRTKSGDKYKVASGIKGKASADAFVAELEKNTAPQ